MRIVLRESIDNDLWKRDLYLQKVDYIINANIYEYDMSDAGLNLAIYYKLLDKKTTDYLKTLSKQERVRQIGLIMRDNREFNKQLTESFRKMRKKFFIENKISENEVLSIKKDAIYLINKTCDETEFRNVVFNLKNRYTSFHKFGNYEFYYRNKGRILDVKGIRDDKLKDHEEYMLSFLKDIFHLLETSDNQRVVNRLKRFASMYKNKELPRGYYRELNADSMYTLILPGEEASMKAQEYISGFDIDHKFNYMLYILSLIQRYFFLLN